MVQLPSVPDQMLWPLLCALWIVGGFFSTNSKALISLGSHFIPVMKSGRGHYLGYKDGTLKPTQFCQTLLFLWREASVMSHAEQAFQRCIGDAAELEGKFGLSGGIQLSLLKSHSWPNLEAVRLTLLLWLFHQWYKWASQPHSATHL